MVKSPERASGVSLRELFPRAEFLGAPDVLIQSCCSDSRRVQSGDLFVALPGIESDGHEFAREALTRGAKAMLVERFVNAPGLPQCVVSDVREAYGKLCQAIAGFPSRQMRTIGITGTNGKTTTTQLTQSVLAQAGATVGTIGTLGIFDGYELHPSMHTTPPAAVLAHWMESMVAADCTHMVMEVSSHALSQRRVAGIEYDAVCFTNIRRDHLDFHGSLLNYRRTKARLLEHLSSEGVVVINADEPELVELGTEVCSPMLTVGMKADADLTALVVERHRSEQTFLLSYESETVPVRTQMIGDHHIYNCLSAAALGVVAGLDLTTIARGLETLGHVPGRLERLECGQPFSVFVDYAHTPDALATVLHTLREVTEGRVICVFGAGGERDIRKRPQMGAVVERGADVAVITTDNPRSEAPQAIARDLLSGFNRPSRAEQIADRAQAIHWALSQARPGDSVLIAGKGHEDYQLVGQQRFYFDDRKVAREILYKLTPHDLPVWARS